MGRPISVVAISHSHKMFCLAQTLLFRHPQQAAHNHIACHRNESNNRYFRIHHLIPSIYQTVGVSDSLVLVNHSL